MRHCCAIDALLAAQCGAEAENLPRALYAEQLARLRRQLRYVRARSRFYGRHFHNAPEDVASLEALADFPFTTARDLTRWQDFLCVSQDAVERMVTLRTSGTTGPPKRLAFSRADLDATCRFFRVGMGQLARRGERVLVLWPGAQRPHGVGALLREALARDGIEVMAGEPCVTEDTLRRELADFQPQVMVAAPSQLAVLATFLVHEQKTGRKTTLRGALSSAESLPPRLARTLREDCGITTLDHYGLTESGYGGGVQCPAQDGYHLRELDVFVEIVDVESGSPLPEGQEGEIVITTLAREAMPLIRYKTGDVAVLISGPCRCGSPLRRLSSIRGRLVREGDTCVIKHIAKGRFCEKLAPHSL